MSNIFDQTFNFEKELGIIDAKPKVCPICKKEHSKTIYENWYEGKNYRNGKYKNWCSECFQKDFDETDLTDEEIKKYAESVISRMQYHTGSYLENYYDWTEIENCKNSKNKKIQQIKDKVKEILEEKERSKKEAKEKLYLEKAEELVNSCDGDTKKVVSKLLMLIDEKIEKAVEKNKPISEMIFG